ncbi:hypothetical protein [Amycolatopsis sp. FDAARGOS 1241]|uniref:hypothetical protein n=1 Tax=Amycolatopsis sp. FDAARGOS 1241 TaxID=2778070 RepID=UPI0019526C4C|nr:hypothetical protein [Amycolatopsis sp. FDAARGOS 1241]QRP45136.1 hypothetical protein I6J71_39135 [Amycolatopsis sp. FDAARGOS 1241]
MATTSPGLYFVGLSFQWSFSSMLVGGAGRDAEHVAKHLSARAGRAAPGAGGGPDGCGWARGPVAQLTEPACWPVPAGRAGLAK